MFFCGPESLEQNPVLLNVLFHGHKSCHDLIKAPRRQQFPKFFKHHSLDLLGQNRYLSSKSWKVVRRAQLWVSCTWGKVPSDTCYPTGMPFLSDFLVEGENNLHGTTSLALGM